MILTDTSVVIDFVRTADRKLQQLIVAHAATICGVTRAEVLIGARNAAHRVRMLAVLQLFQQLPIPDTLWGDIGDNLAALRRSGITVPFNNVVIATVAVSNGIELWTRDKQFAMMQQILTPLQLFQEPP